MTWSLAHVVYVVKKMSQQHAARQCRCRWSLLRIEVWQSLRQSGLTLWCHFCFSFLRGALMCDVL